MVDQDSLLSSSATGLGFSVLFQALSRVLNFIVNQFTIRLSNPLAYGFATIKLEVLQSTILFLSREAIRLALQRSPPKSKYAEGELKLPYKFKTKEGQRQVIINVSLLPLYVGFGLCLILTPIYLKSSVAVNSASLAIGIYVVSSLLRLLSEQLYQQLQWEERFARRASCEGYGVVSNCFATFIFTLFERGRSSTCLPFAIGNFVESVTCFYFLWKATGFNRVFFVPTPVNFDGKEILWDKDIITNLGGQSYQLVLKHVLTEGDKLMASWLATPTVQGLFALATNYGSIFARILLRPIEEQAHIVFAQLNTDNTTDGKKKASDVASLFIRLYLYLALFVVFGSPYSLLLLNITAGRQWSGSDAASVLSIYAYYVPVMAINGITEAYFVSTASVQEIISQTRYMLFISVAYFLSGLVFLQWFSLGPAGFIYSNMLNLGLRIIISIRYMYKRLPNFKLKDCSPGAPLFLLSLILRAVTQYTTNLWKADQLNTLLYIASAAFSASLFSICIAYYDRLFFKSIRFNTVRNDTKPKDTKKNA
ncbi:Man5GlcNac2-PP-Dol translocation protein Rft1 [Schizosaccharomyces japonicus yFS275]|uniref:Man(5)GlcNAc(2)-PP-dolichol translocation protein RFT1 n=1 Tax=Schizosaccharomyces japonicus (strain yFS275 / FY16936) TaxID=402676 RepID=B6K507_SCHJY|nr:Man5GlcNac2-PP-Dol translocation protein Rft1 [Schizosaccharomyces japonicus yFS275]EEB08611.1 Man5GlcNac2-PP-Dol translocation protein Rft1 [Schizosaccharomyces japonicus yFS275]